jgi:hypothetical protein
MSDSEMAQNSTAAESGPPWFSRHGFWFWIAAALGAAVRIYLVVFTEGTYDAGLWQLHAMRVTRLGLLDYYHSTIDANHPPMIFEFGAFVWRVSQAIGIPFSLLFRAPFACLDAASALLLLKLLGCHPRRFLLTAAYWLNPLAILFSAYQGNTDTAIAFFLLLSVWLLSKRRVVSGAIAVGLSFWIKLAGILAVPALVLYLRNWRARGVFVLIAATVALAGYFPWLIKDAAIIATDVFSYHGRMLQTQAGVAAWGPRVILFSVIASPEKWPEQLHAPVLFFLQHNWQIGLLLAFGLILLRRQRRSLRGLCATIAMAYVVLCGMTDYWAFQYFAWSLPFWFFLRPWFYLSATTLVTAYLYSLYWTLCGNPGLRGTWDFAAHLEWPASIIFFRNAAVIFFTVCACAFVIAAIVDQIKTRRRRSARSRAASELQTGHS